MSEFKVIETQEQLDAVLGERLKRERETNEKKYEGYTSPDALQKIKDDYEKQIKALEDAATETQSTLADKDAKIAEGEKYRTDLVKTRIALKAGLDMKYADRLRGENEEEWTADAKSLAEDFAAAHVQAPLGTNEPKITKEQASKRQFENWLNENL